MVSSPLHGSQGLERAALPSPSAPSFVSGSQPTSWPREEAGPPLLQDPVNDSLLTDRGGSPRSLHPHTASGDPPFHPGPHTAELEATIP